MLMHEHSEALLLADEADLALKNGDFEGAAQLYSRAADLEATALAGVAREKTRTFGILAVSLATLLYRAHRFNDATEFIHNLLTSANLLATARRQLVEILTEIAALPSMSGAATVISPVRTVITSPSPAVVVTQALPNPAPNISTFADVQRSLLVIAMHKFNVPEVDAEWLITEVFTAYLLRGTSVANEGDG